MIWSTWFNQHHLSSVSDNFQTRLTMLIWASLAQLGHSLFSLLAAQFLFFFLKLFSLLAAQFYIFSLTLFSLLASVKQKMPQSGICPAPCVLRQCTSMNWGLFGLISTHCYLATELYRVGANESGWGGGWIPLISFLMDLSLGWAWQWFFYSYVLRR